ncbi:uncharacterized protein LOC141704687 [Apium graveolens]|uniref:uncharacterized protein LOC141704687 n=1 Tax=Apium graveolens TaxID=4045 RepID=UPI003D798706
MQAEYTKAKKQRCEEFGKESEDVPEEKPKILLVRAYPSTFSKVVSGLSKDQKEWVTKVGFGPLLSFELRTISREIGINVLWWYDHNNSEMLFPNNKSIKVDEKDVNLTLGLPRGEQVVQFEKDRSVYNKWRAQFNKKRITELMVANAIGMSTEADEKFKQNFTVLMTNLFIRTDKTANVSQYALRFKGNYENTKSFNWCKPVLDNIKEAHESWWKKPHSQYYTGSLVFLLFLYLDRTKHERIIVERTLPPFIGWKTSLIANRSKAEMYNDSFGKGQTVEKFKAQNKEGEYIIKNTLSDQDQLTDKKDNDPSTVHLDNQTEVFDNIHVDEKNEDRQQRFKIDHIDIVEEFINKEFEVNNIWRTPKETIQGVRSSLFISDEELIDSDIMSIAKEIEKNHTNIDIITEQEMISQLEVELTQMESIHEKIKKSLKQANTLFPNNEKWKELQEKFAKISGAAEKRSDKQTKEVVFGLNKLRREHKVSEFQKSPFLNRTIDFNRTKLTKAEDEVWIWINAKSEKSM